MTSYGRLSKNKTFINCTIVKNDCQNGGNYGFICHPQCELYNCILSDNMIGTSKLDIRPIYDAGNTSTSELSMVNCIFVNSQKGVDENWQGLINCKKVTSIKFVNSENDDYTLTPRSEAYDTGYYEPWILSTVGDKDLDGNPRIYYCGIDIGAYECQNVRPGIILINR